MTRKEKLLRAAIAHDGRVITELLEQRAVLLAACKTAVRKLRGKNIFGEQLEARALKKLNCAIRRAQEEI